MSDSIQSDFENIDLGDKRLGKRFLIVLGRMMDSPMKSIQSACRGWAETMAAYRLFNNLKLTPEAILAPHREALVIRAREHPCVLVIQDTSELDFSSKECLKGSGPLNSEKRRGFLAHNHYVITEDRIPLGVLNTHIYARKDEDFRKKRKNEPIENKESYRWLKGYKEACELAEKLPDTEVFSISDREGDIYELYEHWDQLQNESSPLAHWIIRANQNRSLIVDEDGAENSRVDEIPKLFAQAEKGKELGTVEYELRSKEQWKKIQGNRVHTVRSNRNVRQRVRACQVTAKPPYRKGSKLPEVSFWVILAEEIDPPEGEQPIRWIILTSKPIKSFEDAQRILKLYLSRWEIEVFHRVLKTGCKVEEIQLKDNQAVLNCIVLYMIVAWRILYMTHLGRNCPNLPCSVVFEEAEWKSALAVSEHTRKKKKPKGEPKEEVTNGGDPPEPTLGEMIQIVAQLGGHLGRKNDGPPGAQAIWQGLSRVRDFAIAWEVFQS